MAGYTRQSAASIINGENITAPPINAEFNTLQDAFNGTTGHAHDGTTGNGPKIDLATSVSGFLPAVNGGLGGKNNYAATTDPTVGDDTNDGYAVGSVWYNVPDDRYYVCVYNAAGAAVWLENRFINSSGDFAPHANNTKDLGHTLKRWKDLFLSGNADIDGSLNVATTTYLGGILTVNANAIFNVGTTTTISNIDVASGAIDNAAIGTTVAASGTFTTLSATTSLTAATADINGGSIDGATVGANSHSTGKFTTLESTGLATLNSVNIDGGAIDGAVIGANSAVAGSFTTISSAGQATLASVDINGGAIDGATIGANSASPITGTTITGTSLVGPVTGNLTGNSSGTHTGPVTGAVTGNLTGNVTSSGTSTFNNVTIDGTLNMNAGTSATITNLSAPTNDNDAARKVDVDNAVANLVDSAPGTLDTLNELAAALGDDADFSTTITNSIATKLPLAGGTMTGAIAMSTNKITGVGDPTAAQDVSSKAYTDQQDALQVNKSGDSMSGNLAMGSNNITGLATPTANDHAVNKSYADNILGSSTAAATSAANAATSESNAATSATNASNSAAAALTSKNAAATSLATFQNQYLGAQGSAPTADPDGSALDVGDLYFDTTAGAMKVYSANGWTNAGSSVNGTTNRYSYTATAGQTVFAATYDAGYVDVFLNGVKQVIGSTKDVTATTGTSIVFNSATSVNDVVDIIGYGTFVLADHLTQTQSDARYVNLSGDTMTAPLHVQTASAGTVTASTQADDLVVENSAEGGMTIITPDNQSARIRFTSPSTNNDVGGATIFYRQNINKMNIGTGVAGGKLSLQSGAANETMILDGSGRVGIGASDPSSGTSTYYDDLVIKNDTSGTGAGITIQSNTSNGFGGIEFRKADGSEVGKIYASSAGGQLGFETGGSTRMTIDGSGNVGITGNLDLPNVNSYITGQGHNVLQVDATRTYYYGGSNGAQFRTSNNASELLNILDGGEVEIPNSGQFKAASSNATKYVRMYAGGGTGKWDIYGNGANLRISDNMSAGVLAVDTGATFGSNVSIGSSEDNPFNWSGSSNNVSITAAGANDFAQLSLKGNGTGGTGINLGSGSVRHAGIFSLDGSSLAFATNAANSGTSTTTRMQIDSAGKIKIGNNVPMWSGQYGGALFLKGNNATGDRHAELTTVDSNGASTGTGLVVKGAGSAINVGINTTAPDFNLHVNKGTTSYSPASNSTVNHVVAGFNTDYDAVGTQGVYLANMEGNWLDGVSGADSAFGMLFGWANNVRGGLLYDARSTEKLQLFSSYGPIEFMTGGTNGNSVPTDSNMLTRVAISPTGQVDVTGGRFNVIRNQNADFVAKFENNGGGGYGIASDNSAGNHIFFYRNGQGTGTITDNGTTIAFNTVSDYRLKTDVQPMTGASARVQALNPVNFEWISAGTRTDGFLAHEAQAIIPECVTGTKDAMRDEEYEVTAAIEATYDDEGNELTAAVDAVMGTRSVIDPQGIDQAKIVPLLTAALQEALTEIASLKTRVQTLEGV